MIENQIRSWVEEQLALGEEPEILRQTLVELDIDENEIMAIIPKNTVKQENHTNNVKTEQEKIMKQIIPEITTPPKPKKIIVDIPEKKVVDLPEPPAPIQETKIPITKIKSDVPKKIIIKQKVDDINPKDKKLGPAKLKMIPLHAKSIIAKNQNSISNKLKLFINNIFHKTKKLDAPIPSLNQPKAKNNVPMVKQLPIKQNIKNKADNLSIPTAAKTQKNIETSQNNEKTQTKETIKQNKTNISSYFVEMALSLIVFLLQICNRILSVIIKIFSFFRIFFRSKASIFGLVLLVIIYITMILLNKYAESKVVGLI